LSGTAAEQTVSCFRRLFGTTFKVGLIGLLTLILLIPLAKIESLLHERLERRNAAVAEITATWGRAQELVGPVLVVPYRKQVKVVRQELVAGVRQNIEALETVTAQACFLPADLAVAGTLAPERRYRGIYEAVVYRGDLTLSGHFTKPDFTEWKVAAADVLWEDATITLAITDLRGIQEELTLKLGDRTLPLLPGCRLAGFGSGVSARLGKEAGAAERLPFELALSLNGSSGIRVAPLGQRTEAKLQSPWPDPSFTGAFLPATRTVSAKGFEAAWQVFHYGRAFPQQWNDESRPDRDLLKQSLFGVELISPVDHYRLVERAIKYGILFVVLAFTAFFLFEVLTKRRIHPFQYTLVGVALCLFYLALLALSEVVGFGPAYLAGAAAATLLVGFYCAGFLGGAGRGLLVSAGLAAVYGFLYIVLMLQDYSLVAGTVGLFAVLFLLMLATRRVDWYARDQEKG
jgi:inner membrane protein